MKKREFKIILILIVGFIILTCVTFSAIKMFSNNTNTPFDAQSCIGKYYVDIKNDFALSGFTNICVEALDDLDVEDVIRNETVSSVSINGINDFSANAEFKIYAKVVIKYHSLKKLLIPFSSEEITKMNADTLKSEFEKSGFKDIIIEEKYDLDPDSNVTDFCSVLVGDKDSFKKDEKVSLDTAIKIIKHKVYKKYDVKIVLNFVSNIVFSTYDVEFDFAGNYEDLAHGVNTEFEYRLKPGKYELNFQSSESSTIKKSVELEVSGETEAAFEIKCYSDRISVEKLYIENKDKVGKKQAMVPESSQNCKYQNYKDVKSLFKNAGFTNIKMQILYDIVFGWTKEGEVARVTIDGKTDFNKGDIFSKNAEIVITYHMKQEDDPNIKEETTINIEPETTKYTEANTTNKKKSSVYYSTNTLETVSDGNSGKYAYKNKGGSYDIYWIIDFDEGYIYNFYEGNGNEDCDRIKIVYGDLNTYVRAIWNDGFDVINYGLHFNYVNNPNHLVVDDAYGFDLHYYPTDLNKALSIRKTKTIINR